MLIEFKVEGFKNFEKELVFDLSKTRNYNFNENAIKDGIVKTGLIYGINGSGKSNLGSAIFDIILHLTDKEKIINLYDYYLNLTNTNIMAKFYYKFKFGNDILEYEYQKDKPQNLVSEVVKINNKLIAEYDYLTNKFELNLEGTKNLNKNPGRKGIRNCGAARRSYGGSWHRRSGIPPVHHAGHPAHRRRATAYVRNCSALRRPSHWPASAPTASDGTRRCAGTRAPRRSGSKPRRIRRGGAPCGGRASRPRGFRSYRSAPRPQVARRPSAAATGNSRRNNRMPAVSSAAG